MLEKLSQLAESAANGVSRRGFVKLLGRAAFVVAAAAVGLFWAPAHAQATRNFKCCVYLLPDGNTFSQCVNGNCPKDVEGHPLVDRYFVSNCLDCTGPLL